MTRKSHCTLFCSLLFLVPVTPSMVVGQDGPKPIFAVNCGGGFFTSSDGIEYAADTGASGGSTHSSNVAISGTTDDALYQSERSGNSMYSIQVPNGQYRVTLYFAETYHAAAGLRVYTFTWNSMRISGEGFNKRTVPQYHV